MGVDTRWTPLDSREALGAALTRLRESAGLSVRDLAKQIGVPHTTIAGYLTGRHLPPPAALAGFKALLNAVGITAADQQAAWIDAVSELRRQPSRPPAEAVPYRGLDSYRPQDAEVFFGRDELTAQLLEEARRGGLVAVVGPSGVGKSSVLGAGLVARWPASVRLITPSASGEDLPAPGETALLVIDQFEEIFAGEFRRDREVHLRELASLTESGTTVVLGLRADFYGQAALHEVLRKALQERQILVGPMTDAELRSVITRPAELARFTVDPSLVGMLLTDLAARPGLPIEASALPLLSHVLRELCLTTKRGRLSPIEYAEIGGIALAVQQSADRVFDALSPTDQDLARRLFLRMVTVDENAIVTRRRAQVTDPEQLAVCDLFVQERLLTVDQDTVSISHEALLWAWPKLADWVADDRAGLDMLRQIRHQTQIWVAADRDESTLYRGGRLAAVADWLRTSGRNDELDPVQAEFLHASELEDTARRGRDRRRTRTLRAMVAASLILAIVATGFAIFGFRSQGLAIAERNAVQENAQRALSRQLASDAERVKASEPNLAAQLAVTAYRAFPTTEARSTLLEMSDLAVPTRINGHDGPTFSTLSSDGKVLVSSDASDGSVRLFDVRNPQDPVALGVARPPAADLESQSGFQLFAVLLTPDQHYLLAGGQTRHIDIWDVSDATHVPAAVVVPAFAGTAVNSLAITPDGGDVFAAGTTGVVEHFALSGGRLTRLSDLTDPTLPAGGTFRAVAVSSDGASLAAVGDAGAIATWARTAGGWTLATTTVAAGGTTLMTVAWRPGARELAVGTEDGSVTQFDTSTGLVPLAGPTEKFGSWTSTLAYSADGKQLAAGSSDSTVRIWSLTGDEPTSTLDQQFPALITDVGFNAAGTELITSSSDGAAKLWPLGLAPLATGGQAFTMSWSADSSTVVGGSAHAPGTPLFRVTGTAPPAVVARIGDTTAAALSGTVALGPRGIAVVGDTDGGVQLWTTDRHSHELSDLRVLGAKRHFESFVFNRAGTRLIAAGNDSSTWDIDVTDPARPRALGHWNLPNPIDYDYWAGVDPTGTLVAVASSDQKIRLVDFANPARPIEIATLGGFTNYTTGAAFSPDGRTLVAASADRTIRLWDVSDPRHPRAIGQPLTGPQNQLFEVEFSADGHKIIAAGLDESVWIWDVSNLSAPTRWAHLETSGQTLAAEFSPDGRRIGAGTMNGRLDLYNADPLAVAADVCDEVGDPLTIEQWSIYLPDEPYSPPCRG